MSRGIETTITLSSKGQLSIPKELRENNALEEGDVFRLLQIGPADFRITRLATPERPSANLTRSDDGFLVFHGPKGSPKITSELVKHLEAETV